MATRGRPRILDRHAIMNAVCNRIAKGALVKDAAAAEHVDTSTVREWGLTEEFAALYARARADQAHAFSELVVDAAAGVDDYAQAVERVLEAEDDALVDHPQRRQILHALSANAIQRDRLRVDALKWQAAKVDPKRYGERQTHEHTGEGGGPITFSLEIGDPEHNARRKQESDE